MKKHIAILVAIAATLLSACKNGQAEFNLEQAMDEFRAEAQKIFADTTKTENELEEAYTALLESTYAEHKTDSLGLYLFTNLAASYWDGETLKAQYEEAPDLIKNDTRIQRFVRYVDIDKNSAPGMDYIDVAGPNALSGEDLSIASVLAQGKPVLVDFWASWCGPCRREIKSVLLNAAKEHEGQLNILGIAVWEEKQEDTVQAMDELGITWPVIFGGGRENSPSELYAIKGIPTMVGITPDGKIAAKSHSAEEVLKALGF